jgi:hypothetical protein
MVKRNLLSIATAVSALVVASLPAQAQTYSNAVVALNPVAYWPLAETVQPPFGAYIATNIGTAGAAGNGFYQTWFQPLNTGTNVIYYQTNNVQHVAGAIGDGDQALNCTRSAAGAGGYVVFPRTTNGVQNTAINIQPPFSIEFWAKPSSSTTAVMPIINEGRVPEQQGADFGFATANETGFCIGQYGGNFFFATFNGKGGDSTKQEFDTTQTPNVWQHMVVTFDGTNQTWFKNGVQVGNPRIISQSSANALGQLYVPNVTAPLLIGTGSLIGGGNGGSEFAGSVDDVAIYTNILDSGRIAAHFAASTAADSSYQTAVLADNPTIYVRLDEPAYPISNYPNPSTYPVAANYGSIGAAGNGYYQPGTTPGVAGPSFSGFGTDSRAVAINGYSGAVDVGAGSLPAALNPTGTSPLTVAGWFQANPADAPSRFQIIAGHGNSSWRIAMDATAAGLRFNPGNGPELQFTNTPDIVTNGYLVNDGKWHFVAGVSDGTTDYLYIDGLLARSAPNVGSIVGTNGDALLGGDPTALIPTYNGVNEPRYFDGQIAHIAYFNNALSGAQIQQLYSAAAVPPFFVQTPQSTTNNALANVTVAANVHGSAPLSYQWYKSGSPVSNQTNANLAFAPSQVSDAGDYVLIATNNFGAVTSSIVTVFLYGPPDIQEQSLTDMQVFAGTSPKLQISATGAQPISYQWSVGGTAIPGATNSSYTIANISAGGIYTCSVTNVVGIASPGFNPVTVTVVPAPTAPYPLAVLASSPMAYYRLNENPDDGAGDNGVTAYDNAGGYNGVYSNAFLAQPGYNIYTDPGNFAAEFGDYPSVNPYNDFAGNVPGFVNFGTTNGGNSQFTVEAWMTQYKYVKGTGNSILGIGYGNGGEQFILDTGGSANGALRFFVRNAAGTVSAATSGFLPANDGHWHHVVGVCDEAGGHVYLYMDGNLLASATIVPGSGLLSSTMPLTIGARESDHFNTVSNDFQFLGEIDEVSVYNRALSATEIQNHYFASGIAPLITQVAPQSLTTNKNSTASFTVSATGTSPLSYQWYDPTMTMIPDQTNATLTLSNLQTTQSGTYTLTINNLYGSATTNVSLTVIEGSAVISTDLSPTNLAVYTGAQVTYSIVASGTPPFAYQWYQDGSAIPNATNSSYSFTALLGTNTYYCSVTNAESAGTPAVSLTGTVVGMPIITLNPANYTDKLKITLSGYTRSETLVDFPVLVKLGAGISGFNYNHFASGTGGDLRFTDATGTRVIPSEIDEWNPSGVSTVWVQVPVLNGPTNYIWAYWGNASDSTAPAGTNVWVPAAFENVPAYQRVYHLKEGAFPFADSTLNFNATNGVAPGQTNGIVGTAASFGRIHSIDAGTNDMGDNFTLSAWINIPPSTSDIQGIWANFSGGFGNPGFAFYVNSYQATDQALVFATGDGHGGGNEMKSPSSTVPFGAWHMVAATVNRTNGTAQFYLDGNMVANTNTVVKDFPTLNDLTLGSYLGGGFGFTGSLDEARVRSSVDSSNWVWASWATVAQNSTLESYSAVNSTVVTVTPVTIRSYASGGNIIVMGSGGSSDAGLQYHVVTATNVATPLAQWTPVLTNNLDGSGNFSNAVPVDLTKPSQYYQVVIP